MWKEWVMIYFKVLFQLVETDENQKETSLRIAGIFKPKYESRT
jgi:hypothetical protein